MRKKPVYMLNHVEQDRVLNQIRYRGFLNAAGDKVTHNGMIYESLVDNNVWEPGVTGTELMWQEV